MHLLGLVINLHISLVARLWLDQSHVENVTHTFNHVLRRNNLATDTVKYYAEKHAHLSNSPS